MRNSKKLQAPMILNGDNKKIFIKDDKIYKVGQRGISEHSVEDLAEVRRREFCRIKSAKECDGRYYFHTKNTLLVHEDLFEEPVGEIEIDGGAFDFHVHEGRVFYITRRMGRCMGFDESQELLFDFQMGAHLWDGLSFYICCNRSLVRFDLVSRVSETVMENVVIKSLAMRDGAIAYADDANILHFVSRGKRLSYHYHARRVMGIIVTPLESLLVVCRDRKLVRIETKRNEKTFLSEFYGSVQDFALDGSCVYVLTDFDLLVYDLRTGGVKKHLFDLPDFEYCKPFLRPGADDDCTPGREIFERNVRRTKVKMPYVFEREEGGCIPESSIVAAKREYVFIYDLAGREVLKIARLADSECFYSSGHIAAFSSRRQRKMSIKIYRIDGDGLLLVREELAGTASMPEDIVFDGGKLLLYLNETLFEIGVPGTLKPLRNKGVRQIEETVRGVFVLDSCGVYKVGTREWILEDENITSFRVLDNVLYVSSFDDGVVRFAMEDGAVEEQLIDGAVADMFARNDVVVTSNLQGGAVVLKKYVWQEDRWIKSGEMAVGELSRIVYDDIYLSIKNRLHDIVL